MSNRTYPLTVINCDITNFNSWLFNLKYGKMSYNQYQFPISTDPRKPESLPLIPISIKSADNDKSTPSDYYGLIDTGSNMSFISVQLAKTIKCIITDSVITGTLTSTECKPIALVQMLCDSTDGVWITLKVIITDIQDPNMEIILGRDFINHFVFEYNGKTKSLGIEFNKER